ncbi:MAG: L-2-hydroxyglutarate oxidase [Actinobacteria bacterium]|nr:L-2-hydroxyglutarate oxidase [Actinomycetota bacterium]
MAERCDVVVVGAGILGLATAWTLLGDRPGLRVAVVDKEHRVAAHQSSHNSGVVHAGVYYAPGSAKARLCRDGKRRLEEFCAERGIPLRHNGKVIVAVDEDELPRLAELGRRATANAVEGLRELDAGDVRALEPNVRAIRGLHSPRTGVVDFALVCRILAAEVREREGEVQLSRPVTGIEERAGEVVVTTPRGELVADRVVTCAGLQSDRVAAMTGDAGDERIVPFRGSWYVLRRPELVNGNVYPVPDPRLPFLGVHLTPRIDGSVWVGPNAVPAGAREGYRRGSVDLRDVRDVLRHPGSWRLASRYAASGARELVEDHSRHLYARAVRRYVPEVDADDLVAGPSGIRAQAVGRDGAMVEDFSIGGSGRVLHVRNAPSPAATSGLSIARELVDRLYGGGS